MVGVCWLSLHTTKVGVRIVRYEQGQACVTTKPFLSKCWSIAGTSPGTPTTGHRGELVGAILLRVAFFGWCQNKYRRKTTNLGRQFPNRHAKKSSYRPLPASEVTWVPRPARQQHGQRHSLPQPRRQQRTQRASEVAECPEAAMGQKCGNPKKEPW